MKARNILGAMFGLAALTFVLASQAQEPQKTDKKADRAAELREDLALREQILARQFAEFEQALLKLKYRLERSPKQEDKDRAVVLGKVLDESRTKGIGVQFDAIVEQLKTKNLGSLPDIKEAADRSSRLADDLKELVKLLREDSRASKLADERKRLMEQIKELEAIIHNQKIVQAQTEVGKTEKTELGKNQKSVTDRTEKLLKDLDGKGGEAKNMKGNAKEAKGKGKDGEGKDTGKSGEAKAGESKDGGKESDGKQGEAKAGEGKEGKDGGKEGAEGKSGEAKSGEAKDGSGKEGSSKGGEAKDSKSGEGKSGEGKEGKGGDGKDGAAKSGEGKSGEAKDGAGKSGEAKSGEAKSGEPKAGGDPKNGKPGEGKPSAEAKPGKGGEAKGGEAKDSKSGKGGDGKSGEAKSGKGGEGGEGKQGEAKSGQGGESSAKDSGGQKSPPQSGAKGGDSGKSPPPGGPQADNSPGKKQVEDGNYKQKEAEDNIAKGDNKEAGDKQGGAVRDLEKAKKKLEDLLRQVREEELERLLAALQARCEKMLAMQIEVLGGTEAVAKSIAENPKKETTRENKQDALRLSDREGEIVLEASKAIEMLEAEGSAVAFPEVFQQVREDMKSVQRRLGTADAGNLTQEIEKDIIASLKEMIDALKKAKQELDDKKSPPPGPPPPSGPPQDQKLLDQIAELKMIRSMQIRVNQRTTSVARNLEQGKEQAADPNLRRDLNNLAERQERIYDITNRIAKGDNK
jgi:hypothetical protein